MLPNGCAISSPAGICRPVMSTPATSATFTLPTCKATGRPISSPASAAGPWPHGSPAGPMIAPCGPAHHPASHGPSPVPELAPTMTATSGPRCSGSSQAADPLSSWESRLRTRLARAGSTAWPATWRASATPSGRPLSRLVPSGRRTAGTGYILWPTPAARDYRAPNNPAGASRAKRPPKSGRQLPNEIVAHLGGITDSSSGRTGSLGWCNPAFLSWLMGYPIEWLSSAPSAMPSCPSLPPR